MSKTAKIIMYPLVIALSWVTGAIAYFMMVSSYFRKKERNEEQRKSIGNYISAINDRSNTGTPVAKTVDESKQRTAPRPIRYPSPNPTSIKYAKAQPNHEHDKHNNWRSYYYDNND